MPPHPNQLWASPDLSPGSEAARARSRHLRNANFKNMWTFNSAGTISHSQMRLRQISAESGTQTLLFLPKILDKTPKRCSTSTRCAQTASFIISLHINWLENYLVMLIHLQRLYGIKWNVKMIMNMEEGSFSLFEGRYSPGKSEENHVKPRAGRQIQAARTSSRSVNFSSVNFTFGLRLKEFRESGETFF